MRVKLVSWQVSRNYNGSGLDADISTEDADFVTTDATGSTGVLCKAVEHWDEKQFSVLQNVSIVSVNDPTKVFVTAEPLEMKKNDPLFPKGRS